MERIGRYQILKRISAGGMGEIYSASFEGSQGFQKKVVIKCLPYRESKLEKYLHHEARVLAKLSHPNIVHIYDYGEENDFYYLVMEEVEGWDLEELIFERGKILAYSAVFILNEVLEGLSYAHGKGVIHRDISPSNILISQEGLVKTADFGVAEFIDHHTQKTLHGKFSYLSPEVAQGKKASVASDLFSLGQVFYEMISGEKYIQGGTDFELLENVKNFKKFKNPLRDQKINLFLEKILQKNPLKRVKSASLWQKELSANFDIPSKASFLEYLRESREKTPVLSPSPHVLSTSSGRGRARRGGIIILGLCTSLLMGVFIFSKLRTGEPQYGFLSLRTKPWSYVEIGEARYETPLYRLKMRAGSHKIKLSFPKNARPRFLDVFIKEGENTTIQESF